MNGLPTEAQQTASLIEAKDVTIAELRRGRDAESHEAAIYKALYKSCLDRIDQQDAALGNASDGLKQSLRRLIEVGFAAFLAGCAVTLLVGWVW